MVKVDLEISLKLTKDMMTVESEIWDPLQAIDLAVAEVAGDKDPVWKQDPVPFHVFVESPDHMAHPPLSERQMDAAYKLLGHEPKRTFDGGSRFSLTVLCWGKGSGKDLLSSLIHCYGTYLLLCMKNPQRYFEWPESEPIDVVNVAYSANQAQAVYFVKFREKIKRWRWLRENFCIYQEGRVINPENDGKPRVKIYNSGYIEFPHLIRAVSESSENESFEGYNVLFWIMDEASAFKNKGGIKRNAHKVYDTLRSSASSRFGQRWKGMILSWPRQEVNDFTLDMYQQSINDPSIAGDFGYTWQIKPQRFYSGKYFEFEGEEIPIEFEDDFRLEPEMSKCKYMCKPQKVQGAFLTYTGRVRECVNQVGRLPLFDTEDILVEHELLNEAGDVGHRKQFVGKRITMFRGNAADITIPRVAHIDAGLTHDATGMVIAHGEPIIIKVQDELTGNFQTVAMNKIVIDACVRWIPDSNKRLQVSLNNVEALLLELITVYGIKFKKISYDQWNSQTSLETLMQHRIATDMHNINFKDYCEVRSMIYNGGVDFVQWKVEKPEDPYWWLIYELEHLINFGQKVDHPETGTKELSDCLAGVNRLLNEPNAKIDVFKKLPRALPTMAVGAGQIRPLTAETTGVMQRDVFNGMPGVGKQTAMPMIRNDKLLEKNVVNLDSENKKKWWPKSGRTLPRMVKVKGTGNIQLPGTIRW